MLEWVTNLTREIQLIWSNKSSKVKGWYLFIRYSMMGSLLLTAYVLSSYRVPLTQNRCKGWMVSISIISCSTLIVGNYVLILQVYSLWDYRRQVLRTLLVGLAVTYGAFLAFSTFSLVKMIKSVVYVDTIVHSCVVGDLPWTQAIAWGCQMLFDLFLLLVSFINAAGRPVKVTAKLVDDLRRDGCIYYLALFVLRLANIVLCSFRNPSWFILGFLIDFAIVNVIMTRLILRIEFMRLPRRKRVEPWGAYDVADGYELHVLEVDPQDT
ncbi:hypothetical protein OF83DRAFT_1150901 [Amylostereum chailletii]|nr:hypothetical protein OF83DRAFT_1150901 [Amylostereum chailletii]